MKNFKTYQNLKMLLFAFSLFLTSCNENFDLGKIVSINLEVSTMNIAEIESIKTFNFDEKSNFFKLLRKSAKNMKDGWQQYLATQIASGIFIKSDQFQIQIIENSCFVFGKNIGIFHKIDTQLYDDLKNEILKIENK